MTTDLGDDAATLKVTIYSAMAETFLGMTASAFVILRQQVYHFRCFRNSVFASN